MVDGRKAIYRGGNSGTRAVDNGRGTAQQIGRGRAVSFGAPCLPYMLLSRDRQVDNILNKYWDRSVKKKKQ